MLYNQKGAAAKHQRGDVFWLLISSSKDLGVFILFLLLRQQHMMVQS